MRSGQALQNKDGSLALTENKTCKRDSMLWFYWHARRAEQRQKVNILLTCRDASCNMRYDSISCRLRAYKRHMTDRYVYFYDVYTWIESVTLYAWIKKRYYYKKKNIYYIKCKYFVISCLLKKITGSPPIAFYLSKFIGMDWYWLLLVWAVVFI